MPEEKLLPRGEKVVVSSGLILEKSFRFIDYFGRNHQTIEISTRIKPLRFLGEYCSTFVRRGLYSERSLEEEQGFYVHEKAPHYIKLRTA